MSKIIEITDFHAPELDIYARLTEGQLLNRHEPEKGMFIAESPKVVERALDAGYLPVSFLVEHRHLESQAKDLICRCPEVPVYTAEFDVLTQLTGFQLTRGMLCAMHRRPLPSVKEICAGAKRIAVLENVVNPTNVGAIFRSAAALHVDAVLLTEACSNPLYRRSIRVSMGTVFQVPWTYLAGETAGRPLRKKRSIEEQLGPNAAAINFNYTDTAEAYIKRSSTSTAPWRRATSCWATITGTNPAWPSLRTCSGPRISAGRPWPSAGAFCGGSACPPGAKSTGNCWTGSRPSSTGKTAAGVWRMKCGISSPGTGPSAGS